MVVFDPLIHPVMLGNVSLDPPTHPLKRYVIICSWNVSKDASKTFRRTSSTHLLFLKWSIYIARYYIAI